MSVKATSLMASSLNTSIGTGESCTVRGLPRTPVTTCSSMTSSAIAGAVSRVPERIKLADMMARPALDSVVLRTPPPAPPRALQCMSFCIDFSRFRAAAGGSDLDLWGCNYQAISLHNSFAFR